MADGGWASIVKKAGGRLIALDGINGGALDAAARALGNEHRDERSCVSVWYASAIFNEVLLATVGAGDPSARTLILLYASDLAYRINAEVRPALEAGRLVIAAPYVDTAIAFGYAAGLEDTWVAEVLGFAPPPDSREIVDSPRSGGLDTKGFVEFCGRQLHGDNDKARLDLLKQAAARLKNR